MPKIKMYKTVEVAKKFGVHTTTIKEWAKIGKLPFKRTIGGHYRFDGRDVCKLFNTIQPPYSGGNLKAKENSTKVILRKAQPEPSKDTFELEVPVKVVKNREQQLEELLSDVWMSIENGSINKRFYEFRSKVRSATYKRIDL